MHAESVEEPRNDGVSVSDHYQAPHSHSHPRSHVHQHHNHHHHHKTDTQQRSTAKREPSECEDRSRKIPRTDSDVEESSAEAVPLVCPSELTGSHSFVFKTDAMDRSLSLDVHLHATHTYTPESASVIIVMHGLNRDVDRYMKEWVAAAGVRSVLLVLPHFDRGQFPTIHEFHHGGMFDGGDMSVPRRPLDWSYNVVERLFLHIRDQTRLHAPGYFIYGHSAGAQFVHRLVVACAPFCSHLLKAVSANAGRYMCPDFNVEFPAGLAGTGVTEADVKKALAMHLCVMLGEEDRDLHKFLPSKDSWHGGKAQGPHRLGRGEFFYDSAQTVAERFGTEFNWRKVIVPGVGHSNKLMSPHAVKYFFNED